MVVKPPKPRQPGAPRPAPVKQKGHGAIAGWIATGVAFVVTFMVIIGNQRQTAPEVARLTQEFATIRAARQEAANQAQRESNDRIRRRQDLERESATLTRQKAVAERNVEVLEKRVQAGGKVVDAAKRLAELRARVAELRKEREQLQREALAQNNTAVAPPPTPTPGGPKTKDFKRPISLRTGEYERYMSILAGELRDRKIRATQDAPGWWHLGLRTVIPLLGDFEVEVKCSGIGGKKRSEYETVTIEACGVAFQEAARNLPSTEYLRVQRKGDTLFIRTGMGVGGAAVYRQFDIADSRRRAGTLVTVAVNQTEPGFCVPGVYLTGSIAAE